MQTLLGKHWHHLPLEEVVALLETSPERGLDVFEVKHRRERFGANVLTPKKGKSPLVRFLLQFNNPLIYILLAAGLATVIFKDPVDALTIFGVVLLNALIGYFQEARAENAIAALAQTLTTEATVIRAGQPQTLPAAELVPGDIVQLQAGNKVPADLRLLRVRDLQVAEAALTGESTAVQKAADCGVLAPATGLADRCNMAYASTLVTYGQGVGIVTAIGDDTEVGHISQLIAAAVELETPLTRKLARLSQWLLYLILGLAAFTFIVEIVRGKSLVETLLAAVALAVGAIPEGLPAAVTVTLAIGVSRMARRKAIIRKLPAVETLGSTTVVCSDKTGTLTQNQMTVQVIAAGGVDYAVTGAGYAPEGQLTPAGESNAALRECLRAGQLCNDSILAEKNGQWEAQGDPTEVALIVAARKYDAARKGGLGAAALPRLDAIPFNSQHQYMATLHDAGAAQPRVVYVKGAVEVLLEKCGAALNATGDSQPLDRAQILQTVDALAARGLRVLALARGELPPAAQTLQPSDIATGLIYLGLQAMIDPPRPEAQAAVRACHAAGVKVKMITGDHARTAGAIAEQLGLQGETEGGTLKVLTGKALAELSDMQLAEAAERTAVFARVAPEQKLRLVEALQARGHIVAMTGDGVNDAPALKQADIGVAMGITGTEVSKEAAAMVLTDDNFASIEAAIEEGRGVFDNLTKFITWTLPTNVGIGLVVLVGVLAGAPLPILPAQILWINMTTAGALGLVLALEPKEPGLMQRPPRNPQAPLLTRALLLRVLLVGLMILGGAFGLYEWAEARGASVAEARTLAVNVIVLVQLFYLLNCRSLTRSIFAIGVFSNRWVIGGVALMIALQLLFTYAPVMHTVLSSAPIGLPAWGLATLTGLAAFGVVEVEKWVQRQRS